MRNILYSQFISIHYVGEEKKWLSTSKCGGELKEKRAFAGETTAGVANVLRAEHNRFNLSDESRFK